MATTGSKSAIGIIAGTGFADQFSGEACLVDTAYGKPAAAYQRSHTNDQLTYYLPRHGNPHRLAPHTVNYRANIDGFRQLGVKQIVAINVVGSIRPEWPSATLILPDQIIDYTWGRQHTFFDTFESAHGQIEHIDFTLPYAQTLRKKLLQAAAAAGIRLHDGGCYAATQGPRLESAAEVERIRRDGGDVIGMTGMPEASLAREAGIDYASICLVSNLAAGIAETELSVAEIMANVKVSTDTIKQLLQVFLRLAA